MLKYHGVPITPFIFVAINFMVVTRPPLLKFGFYKLSN